MLQQSNNAKVIILSNTGEKGNIGWLKVREFVQAWKAMEMFNRPMGKVIPGVFSLVVMLAIVLIYSHAVGNEEVGQSKTADEEVAAESGKQHRGEVSEVDGRARKLPELSEDWIKAEKGSAVLSGDKVRTLRESRAELTLKELNIIRMAPLTTIDIVKLYEETKEGLDETQIDVEQGDIWALVTEVEEDVTFNVSTPVAGAAITGTKFRISVNEDSSTVLKVYKGEVRVTNAPGKEDLVPESLPQKAPERIQGPQQIPGPRQVTFEEWYYIVKNMQEIRISGKGELLASGSFSMNDPDEQSEWVQWNLERDKAINR